MADTFKPILGEDIVTTRKLLHEAIPITGTIVSGTYEDENIKYFAHGMYEAVYDYPYLSSSANHIFDITAGYASGSDWQDGNNSQDAKKINIYNQMAQVHVGYDISGNIQQFDADGTTSTSGDKMTSCFFMNFARLLAKDEIKKDSFRFTWYSSNVGGGLNPPVYGGLYTIGDYGAATTYLSNSPAGEYGLLYTGSSDLGDAVNPIIGHIYYQSGVVVLSSSIIENQAPTHDNEPKVITNNTASAEELFKSNKIEEVANGFRFAYQNLSFNNTVELNSTVYFCRANNTEFNYSSNPTYISNASEIVVKGSNPNQEPISFITTVGLYSADNELLAVAKLSEPLKKSPSNEITLKVRLDY
jgi:hypothetical protein